MTNREDLAAFLAKQAEAFIRQQEARDARKVRDLWSEWGAAIAQTARAAKLKDHSRFLDYECRAEGEVFCVADLSWADCTTERMGAWLAMLASSTIRKGKRAGQPISAGYQYQVRMSLQACFRWHVRRRNITHSPFDQIPLPREEPNRRRGYATREVSSLLQAKVRPIAADMLEVLFETGLRNSAVRLMEKDKVDLRNETVTYRAKRGKWKVAVLSVRAVEVIAKWMGISRGPYVFAHPAYADGRPISMQTFGRWIRDGRREAGGLQVAGEPITPHHFRHGLVAELMTETNLQTSLIAEQLGVSEEVISSRYGHMRGGLTERVRNVLNRSTTEPVENRADSHEGKTRVK